MKAAVVIPVYKNELNDLEKISLAQVRKVLSKYPIIFAAPEGKVFPYFQPRDLIAHFPKEFFQDRQSYSRLMMSADFYATFADFDYVLIYQLDAFVFYDALEDFCRLGYDFIGAPWPFYSWSGTRQPKTPRVGNGGFSLRKAKACHKLLTQCAALPNWADFLEYTEDAFFAFCGVRESLGFKVAPVAVAEVFSMEHLPARFMRKYKNLLPFGCHNWHKFSADFYVKLLAKFGYDLRPFRAQMDDKDITHHTPNYLAMLAMERLIRRAEHGQSIANYLSIKRFATIKILRDSDAIKILARLIQEENFLANHIIFYDDADTLLREIEREILPHLILTLDDDDKLISQIESKGLIYGEHVISFQREYLQRCEKIFHALGK